MIEKSVLLPLKMLNGSVWKHEIYIKCEPPVEHSIISATGIPRSRENDRSLKPKDRSALWFDGENIATFRTSPTGTGLSEGDTFESSLADRINLVIEAVKLASSTFSNSTISLAGASMGGHVVIRACEELEKMGVSISNIFLASPCLYDDRVEGVNFGEDFRKYTDLKGSDSNVTNFETVQYLRRYPGRVFAFYQQYDADLEKGGVKDIDKVMSVMDKVMADRSKDGRNDSYFIVEGGRHGFKDEGLYPSPDTVGASQGSTQEQKVSQMAIDFL